MATKYNQRSMQQAKKVKQVYQGGWTVTGTWEDSSQGRRCQVKDGVFLKSYAVKDELDGDDKQGSFVVNGDSVTLCAPWGRHGAIRTWVGNIEKNGTQIRWTGRKGETFWYKIKE